MKKPKRWSRKVTEESHALVLEQDVFTWDNPKRIAASLKRSAEASDQRKAGPFQAAMSMLNFYINRAGSNLSRERKAVLNEAKIALRKVFGRLPEE
ncbi:MAG: DUF3175 domain-containing protein [Gammaproteobacteria bacterium]